MYIFKLQIRIQLNQYTTKTSLQNAITYLPYSGGKTNTTGGLRLARTGVIYIHTFSHTYTYIFKHVK